MSAWPPTTPNGVRRPGSWIGSGMAGIDGVNAGDPVTAEQMRALFGCGYASVGGAAAAAAGRTLTSPRPTSKGATRLGVPFKIVDIKPGRFRVEVAKRIAAFNAAGRAASRLARSHAADRARIRTEVAGEFFARRAWPATEQMPGRWPGTIAKHSRPRSAVGRRLRLDVLPGEVGVDVVGGRRSGGGGGDRTGPPGCRSRRSAVPREARRVHPGPGRKGSGRSTSAAWSRPRSPTGTAAPATRICTPMSRWRTRSKPSTAAGCPSTDGCCSKLTVAASETYNTALEQHLRDRLGSAVRGSARHRSGEAADPGDRRCRPAD